MLTYIIGLLTVVSLFLLISGFRYSYKGLSVINAYITSLLTSAILAMLFVFFAYMYYQPTLAGQYPEEYARYKENQYTLVDYANLGDRDLITDEVREKATALDEENRVLLRELNVKLDKSEVKAKYREAQEVLIKLGLTLGYLIGFGHLWKVSELELREEKKEKLYKILKN